jgi:hypothetical protein
VGWGARAGHACCANPYKSRRAWRSWYDFDLRRIRAHTHRAPDHLLSGGQHPLSYGGAVASLAAAGMDGARAAPSMPPKISARGGLASSQNNVVICVSHLAACSPRSASSRGWRQEAGVPLPRSLVHCGAPQAPLPLCKRVNQASITGKDPPRLNHPGAPPLGAAMRTAVLAVCVLVLANVVSFKPFSPRNTRRCGGRADRSPRLFPPSRPSPRRAPTSRPTSWRRGTVSIRGLTLKGVARGSPAVDARPRSAAARPQPTRPRRPLAAECPVKAPTKWDPKVFDSSCERRGRARARTRHARATTGGGGSACCKRLLAAPQRGRPRRTRPAS